MLLWRAYYSNDDTIVVPIQTWNNEPIKYINCVYRSFDLKNNTVRIIKIIKDGNVYQYDSSEYNYIIPDSVAEGQLNILKKFAETHEKFLHRFD
jgi:hypothetical protein